MAFEDIREMLDGLDFEAWLDLEGVDYRVTTGKSGRELNIRHCPMCGGDSWKVYFNPMRGQGVCFHGSHPQDKQYNVFRFLQAFTGKRGRELADYIEQVSVELGYMPKVKTEIKSDVSLVQEIRLPASLHISREMEALPEYLLNRGLSKTLCEYFDLRWSESGVHVFWDSEAQEGKTQDFSKRVMIPVYDLEGKLATFQGRDVTGEARRKYLFPQTLPASGRYLYNGHNAVGKETVIVGEGAFDVIGVKRALLSEPTLFPFVEPIGTFGMHLSGGLEESAQDQIGAFLKLKAKGLKNIVLMWDTEQKTIPVVIASAKKLIGCGFNVRIAALGEDEDPGEAPPEKIIAAYYRAKKFDNRLAMMLKLKGWSAIRN